MSTMREAVSCTLAMLSSASGAMARQASAWAGTKISRLQVLHLVQGGEAGLHVDEEGDMMLGKRRFTGKAVGKADGAVRRSEASHVKGVAWQGEALPARPQRLRLQRLDIAFLGHEELAAQVAGRIVPVEESRLPKRVARKRALYAAGIDAASGLALEAAVSADMVGMRVVLNMAFSFQPRASRSFLTFLPASLSLPLSIKETSLPLPSTTPILAGL